jgi:hypothetical protein
MGKIRRATQAVRSEQLGCIPGVDRTFIPKQLQCIVSRVIAHIPTAYIAPPIQSPTKRPQQPSRTFCRDCWYQYLKKLQGQVEQSRPRRTANKTGALSVASGLAFALKPSHPSMMAGAIWYFNDAKTAFPSPAIPELYNTPN